MGDKGDKYRETPVPDSLASTMEAFGDVLAMAKRADGLTVVANTVYLSVVDSV
jgi:hypothetical protein